MNEYFLGVDVSKGYSDLIIIDEEKRTEVESFQLDDTETGHQQLSIILKKILDKQQNSIIYCAVESTGGYENNWFNSLLNLRKELNVEVARLNPFGTKHNSDASMNRVVTDKNAARNIAEYYMVTRTAIVHNPLIKEIYERHVKKGMNKTAAMGVCMHKILRIIYGMLKNNEEFNPEKDRANSMKMSKNSTRPTTIVIKQNKLRRYQQPDESAPISNRQAKKRKKQKLSQDEIISSSTGSNISSFHK